jgi:sortase A
MIHGRTIWIVAEIALSLCGVTLLAICGGSRLHSRFQAKSAIAKFEALNEAYSRTITQGESEASSPEVDFSGWDARRVRACKASLVEQAGAPLAVLEIARVHLEAPVFDGADDRTLERGAGRIAGTARPGEPGNIGIAAHRDSFFRALKDVKLGDSIKLKSLDRMDTYTVDRIEIVTPKDASVLALPVLTGKFGQSLSQRRT